MARKFSCQERGIMENLFAIIIMDMLIGVVCAVVATNLINGLKESVGLTEIKTNWLRVLLIKLLTFGVDGFIAYWVYFKVMYQTDWFTFVVIALCTIAGAETVYNIINQLKEVKEKYPVNEDGGQG